MRHYLLSHGKYQQQADDLHEIYVFGLVLMKTVKNLKSSRRYIWEGI